MVNLLAIEDFPLLECWVDQNLDRDIAMTSSEKYVFGICNSLKASSEIQKYKAWKNCHQAFIVDAIKHKEIFTEIEGFLSRKNFDLNHHLSLVAEYAVMVNKSDELIEILEETITVLPLVIFKFLKAWVAFNDYRYDLCIKECMKMSQDYAEFYGLHGQALIEMNMPELARVIIKKACKLGDNNALHHFQLAKAEYLCQRYYHSWHALERCHTLTQNNSEVALFSAIIAEQLAHNKHIVKLAWNYLLPFFNSFPENAEVVTRMMKLSMLTGDERDFLYITSKVTVPPLLKDPEFVKNLGSILTGLQGLSWSKSIETMLQDFKSP